MKSYIIRESIPESAHKELTEYPELMRQLLFYRGIDTSSAKAQEFLNPDYSSGIHDPFLMADMDTAVERILKALKNDERILIYSDYDADGIPGAVVMHDFFSAIGYKNFEIYIPNRHTEGYGLHLEAVDSFVERNVKLLITLDCGIVDLAEVKRAGELGIDVIVTDHHEPGAELPEAVAVLNAKRTDCDYPCKVLCGSGVAFKLIQGILARNRFDLKEGAEKWFLDMVGIATLSDMVPLHGENRIFAHYGLKVLRKSRRPGLQKLLALTNVDQRYISEDDIGFMVTPRINAASRMGVPHDAFHMLSEKDELKANTYAEHLNRINDERKGLVASLVKEVKKIMSEREAHFAERKVIVLGNPDWRPAILGLVANSVAEEHGKPVFLWGREDAKYIKGSCRSDGVTNLVKLMTAARDAFLDFGGHTMSGGFSVHHEKIHELEHYLHSAFESLGNEAALAEPIVIDAKLSLDDVHARTHGIIEKLSPFGVGNLKPLFIFENVTVAGIKQFGKKQDHLELSFKTNSGRTVRAIGFFMTSENFGKALVPGAAINLVANIEKSYFRNIPELRLRIVDVQP